MRAECARSGLDFGGVVHCSKFIAFVHLWIYEWLSVGFFSRAPELIFNNDPDMQVRRVLRVYKFCVGPNSSEPRVIYDYFMR